MASVWAEIELEDVSTRDLLDELENRYLDDREQERFIGFMNNSDTAKFKLFLQVKNKYSVLELEELFSEKCVIMPVPKNQLSLEL